MKSEWCYFKSYVSPDLCQKIISDALIINSQDAIVGYEGNVDTSIRKSKVRFINEHDVNFKYVFDILWKTLIWANKDFFDIHISKLDFFQFTEYSEHYKGEYKEHHDVFWLNDTPYHRKISCVIQLSDPNTYEGGDFQLTDCGNYPPNEDIKLQGSILFFPSFLRHKVMPVTKGTRYSLVAWFEGPKWR